MSFEGSEELMADMAYHSTLHGLVSAMNKPGRELTIGHVPERLSGSDQPQLMFIVPDGGPITSITLPAQLLFALANSNNFRMLIEDEIIKCEERCEAEGLDIHVPLPRK